MGASIASWYARYGGAAKEAELKQHQPIDVALAGVNVSQLAIAVFGVVVTTGEYSKIEWRRTGERSRSTAPLAPGQDDRGAAMRVVIAEDQVLLREGLKRLFQAHASSFGVRSVAVSEECLRPCDPNTQACFCDDGEEIRAQAACREPDGSAAADREGHRRWRRASGGSGVEAPFVALSLRDHAPIGEVSRLYAGCVLRPRPLAANEGTHLVMRRQQYDRVVAEDSPTEPRERGS
jgi:hypothetical protein